MITTPILDLLLIDTHNGMSLGISDFSQYPIGFSIVSPSLEITAPGFSPVNIAFEPKSMNIYTSENIGIVCTGQQNVELPDGIYKVKYTISPAYTYFVERSFIRVDILQEKFDTAFMKLDIFQCDGIIRKQREEELDTINFYIQGSIAAANKCAGDLALKMYRKADKMLTSFITHKCNC